MFIIIVFDLVLTCSSVSSHHFFCSLPRDQSRDVTHRLGVSVILQCTSFRLHAFSFRLLLLRVCGNRCAVIVKFAVTRIVYVAYSPILIVKFPVTRIVYQLCPLYLNIIIIKPITVITVPTADGLSVLKDRTRLLHKQWEGGRGM